MTRGSVISVVRAQRAEVATYARVGAGCGWWWSEGGTTAVRWPQW